MKAPRALAPVLVLFSAGPATAVRGARVLQLEFADGATMTAAPCAGRRAPPFECAAGDGDCRTHIATEVERLFADFDVKVAAAARSREHLTVVVSSAGGAWCGVAPAVRGIAPVNCHGDGRWGTTGYVFSCDRDIPACAARIAQEAAHLVGLDHTTDPTDVMYPFETSAPRFQDRELKTLNPQCGWGTQNSYRLLQSRLAQKGQ